MKILFPTPVSWDGNAARYFQRDGGRLAQWVSEHGHEGVKVIYSGDTSLPPPETPLLAMGTPQQWLDPAFWESFHADAALVYFGISPQRAPIVQALKRAGLRVLLKMDASWGFYPPFRDLVTRICLDYFHHLESPSGTETAALAQSLRCTNYLFRSDRATFRTGIASLLRVVLRDVRNLVTLPEQRAYFALFDLVTTELPFAERNLRTRLRDIPHAPSIVTLPHPCLDGFRFVASDRKEKLLLAVANHWLFPRKGGKLLARTLAQALPRHPEYRAVLIGPDSDLVKQRAEHDAGHRLPIDTHPLLPREELEGFYRKAQVFLLSSGAEGAPNVIFEALASGCSIVYTHSLRQLDLVLDSPVAGTPARRYTPTAFAAAIDTEIAAWASLQRNPTDISSHYHEFAALSYVGPQFLSLLPS